MENRNTSESSPRFAGRLTSRRGAWVTLLITLVAMVIGFGLFSQAKAPEGISPAPADAESSRVSEILSEFPDADRQSVLTVATRVDGEKLTHADQQRLQELATTIDAANPQWSDDGEAAVIVSTITVGESNTETAEVINDLRHDLQQQAPAGIVLQTTGGPAFGADVASAFDGANFTLLAVTIAIVAVLLIVTYRSPVLWLIPLLVVGLADGLAGRVTAYLGETFALEFDTGIISVLVFGAGTNYALLLISRYREELTRSEDHRLALARAWRATFGAIAASNVTVVLSLLTLVLAVIPGTHGLGVTSAAGLLIAALSVLFMLPPLLALVGKKVFWPFIPAPATEDTPPRRSVWRGIATRVQNRPWVSLAAGIGVLAVMSVGLVGTSVGLTQVEKFRVASESAAGLETLSEHYAPGEAQPYTVIADSDETGPLLEAINELDGVVRAHPVAENAEGDLVQLMVTGEYAPGTPESLELVEQLRQVTGEHPQAHALVGGGIATDFDARTGNTDDVFFMVPLILAVSFIVLIGVTRSLLAPVLLLLVNVGSALAAIGAGAWLSRTLFDQPALDLQVPLLAFLFLVALGIDYTIFLVHRARTEASVLGTRAGMREAVTHTGAVITSAGIVLAGVFAALGVLPLVTLGQLGLIVGLGVIVDTVLVRSVIVPALFGVIGERIWWPGRPASQVREGFQAPQGARQ